MEYSDITKDDVKFITIAEYGAMGASGEIELLSLSDNKFTLYSGNMCYGKKIMDMNEFHQVFSELKNISCFHEECSGLPDNWKYMNLGFGNYLFVSSDIYDYFKTLIDYVPRKTKYPYRTWKTCAVITLALLEKGLLDNNILETMKELHLEQNSDDDWQNYIAFINKLHKDYDEVSLNKKENPNYVESDKQKAMKETEKKEIVLKFLPIFNDIVIISAIIMLCLSFGGENISEGIRYGVSIATVLEITLLAQAESVPKGFLLLIPMAILYNPFKPIGESWSCWSIINIITIIFLAYCIKANHTNKFKAE